MQNCNFIFVVNFFFKLLVFLYSDKVSGTVGNTESDLTGPSFEPQASRSREERVTA